MIRKLQLGLAALALTVGLAGCSAAATNTGDTSANTSSSNNASTVSNDTGTSEALTTLLEANQASHYSSEDATYDESQVVDITLSGTTATTTGEGVTVTEGAVTIEAAGTYRLSGTFQGQITVNADAQDVQLILNGVELTNNAGSPLVLAAADEVTLILAEGTTNSVSDASTYADTSEGAPSSAIESSVDLSIAGTGALTVTGNNNDAINSADGLVIAGGNVTVTAVDDGIRGKDYVIISDGTVSVQATGDGIKADNETDADRGYVHIAGGNISISSGDDGIKGFTDVAVSGGNTVVTQSVEAMEAQAIVIADGDINLTSSDDAINVSGDAPQGFTITGGTITVDAGGDGLDSNSSGVISGGTAIIFGPTNDGNGALDVEQGLTVTGGELWALGAAGMATSPSQSSTQAFVFTKLSQAVSGEVAILDADGNQITTVNSEKQFSSVVYSGPAIVTDGTYQVNVNGQSAGTVAANQYQTGMPGGPGGGGRPGR
ncbi:MAG: carbohydrate-binding domain-containing protein [Propionibacteriaceae bacterium]|nr:carbohydrate-binding domain-containing protein [Propionibacteriaceae bacterium]